MNLFRRGVVGFSSMGPVIFFALLLGWCSRLGNHGVQVPAMVLPSLLTVGGTNVSFTYLTILETLIGGVIGVLTDAAVLAPLHLRRPRERVAALARQVQELLDEMADGLRNEWDADLARHWYRAGSEITAAAPEVIEEISTGRESTRLNPRHNIRAREGRLGGYERTIEALRRTQWQVTGIARTLVDAVDERARQPAPSPNLLARYADALDALADAVIHFGLHDEKRERRSTARSARSTRSSPNCASSYGSRHWRTQRPGRSTGRSSATRSVLSANLTPPDRAPCRSPTTAARSDPPQHAERSGRSSAPLGTARTDQPARARALTRAVRGSRAANGIDPQEYVVDNS